MVPAPRNLTCLQSHRHHIAQSVQCNVLNLIGNHGLQRCDHCALVQVFDTRKQYMSSWLSKVWHPCCPPEHTTRHNPGPGDMRTAAQIAMYEICNTTRAMARHFIDLNGDNRFLCARPIHWARPAPGSKGAQLAAQYAARFHQAYPLAGFDPRLRDRFQGCVLRMDPDLCNSKADQGVDLLLCADNVKVSVQCTLTYAILTDLCNAMHTHLCFCALANALPMQRMKSLCFRMTLCCSKLLKSLRFVQK